MAAARPGSMPHRRLVIGLSLFSAVSAIAGGAVMLLWPHGSALVPLELIRGTPFQTFLVPGILLAGVVGGVSLACAALAWRRSRFAIDATVVAGTALTLWIVAEVALFRDLHWLHVFCGGLGLAILALGLLAVRSSPFPRHRWMLTVTLAETAGFLAPAVAGIFTAKAGLGPGPQVAVMAAAGMLEGFACGAGQAWALPLPVRRLRFALLTALGAGVVWATVMSAMQLASPEGGPSVPILAQVIALAGAPVIGLLAIGTAQWLELRHYAFQAHRWIAWTALAWTLALPMSFLPSPLVDESTPVAAHVALWGSAGLLMAYVMALVTWQGVRRLQPWPGYRRWSTAATATLPVSGRGGGAGCLLESRPAGLLGSRGRSQAHVSLLERLVTTCLNSPVLPRQRLRRWRQGRSAAPGLRTCLTHPHLAPTGSPGRHSGCPGRPCSGAPHG